MGDKRSSVEFLPEATRALEKYITDLSQENEKKASSILYWAKTYIRFLEKEGTYNPRKGLGYERGNIIKVDFGFRIGNEFGGLHYAVVISKHNPKASGTLVFVHLADLPLGIRGLTQPNTDGTYTVLLNARYSHDMLKQTLEQEIGHITSRDFDRKESVDVIEKERHMKTKHSRGEA